MVWGGLSLLWVPHESRDWLTEVTWGRNKLENKGSEDSSHQDEDQVESIVKVREPADLYLLALMHLE